MCAGSYIVKPGLLSQCTPCFLKIAFVQEVSMHVCVCVHVCKCMWLYVYMRVYISGRKGARGLKHKLKEKYTELFIQTLIVYCTEITHKGSKGIIYDTNFKWLQR